MTADTHGLTKETMYETLIRAKTRRDNAVEPVENLTLEMLSRPDDALKKINGSAADRQTPDYSPDLDHHQSELLPNALEGVIQW